MAKMTDEHEEDQDTPEDEQCPFVGEDGHGEVSRCVLPAGHEGPRHLGRNF